MGKEGGGGKMLETAHRFGHPQQQWMFRTLHGKNFSLIYDEKKEHKQVE